LEGAEVHLPPGPDASLADALADLRALADALRTGPARRIELTAGALYAATPDGGEELVLADLAGTSHRALLGRSGHIELTGRLGEAAGSLALDVETHADRTTLDLELADVALARLPAALGGLGPVERLGGQLGGSVHYEDGADRHLELALAGRDVKARLPSPEGPRELALAAPRVDARVEFAPESLRLVRLEVADGPTPLHLHGTIALPLRDASAVELELAAHDLGLAQGRRLLERLPVDRKGAGAALDHVEAGRLARAQLHLDTTVAGLRELLAGEVMARPGELRLEVTVADVLLRVGESRLGELSGTLVYDGDALEIRGLEARLDGESLPRLDGGLTGLARLRGLDELRCRMPAPVPELPGLPRLARYVESRQGEPSQGSWWSIHVSADWVSHPALLCGLEQLDALLSPTQGGFELEIARGVWAGVEMQGRASYRAGAAGTRPRVEIEAALGSPFEAMALVPPAEPWARGRFEVETRRLGTWRIRGAEGAFRASGDRVEVEELEIPLDPGGVARGSGDLVLGDPERVTYRLALAGDELDATELALAAQLREARQIRGRGRVEAEFTGPLIEGQGMLAHADGSLEIRAREGAIERGMPVLLALLVADEPLSPLSDLDALPYDTLEVDARLVDGTFESEHAELAGPKVRMIGTGRLGAEGDHPLQAVLGVLFFPRVDSIIERLPVLNRMILGENGNLVGAYYALEGPWAEPEARLIPVKSIVATGPTSFVLEDIPGFLWSGLKRIHSILLPQGGRPPARDATLRVDS
jgi:hypothetical protein